MVYRNTSRCFVMQGSYLSWFQVINYIINSHTYSTFPTYFISQLGPLSYWSPVPSIPFYAN